MSDWYLDEPAPPPPPSEPVPAGPPEEDPDPSPPGLFWDFASRLLAGSALGLVPALALGYLVAPSIGLWIYRWTPLVALLIGWELMRRDLVPGLAISLTVSLVAGGLLWMIIGKQFLDEGVRDSNCPYALGDLREAINEFQASSHRYPSKAELEGKLGHPWPTCYGRPYLYETSADRYTLVCGHHNW